MTVDCVARRPRRTWAWFAGPLGALYGAGAAWRRRRAKRPGSQRRLSQPVISVGNLTLGGAGKTPLVATIARWLCERGERPAVLSRGYGRLSPTDGVVVVRDADSIRGRLAESGDEPLMLARALPGCAVVVAADRYQAGLVAETQLACTVHVLDDGFQHLGLHRDIDLLLLDPSDVTAGRPLPAGRLREAPAAAGDADAWFTECAQLRVLEPLAVAAGVSRVFGLERHLASPQRLDGEEEGPGPEGQRALLVSGLARPERFEQAIVERGWTVVGHMAFADHHPFAQRDIDDIAARVSATRATLVLTTDKDAVRLEPLAPWPFPIFRVPLNVTVEPAVAFTAWLADAIAAARR